LHDPPEAIVVIENEPLLSSTPMFDAVLPT
jgi:hypothetical protein